MSFCAELEWRQVDSQAGTVRLEPGTTENKKGRQFPMTDDLRTLLERQKTAADQLKKTCGASAGLCFTGTANRSMISAKDGRKRAGKRAALVAAHNPSPAMGLGSCPRRSPSATTKPASEPRDFSHRVRIVLPTMIETSG